MLYSLNPFRNPIGIYEEKDFFSREEIKKILTLKSELEFNKGFVGEKGREDTEIRSSDIAWILGKENTQWLYSKVGEKIMSINAKYYQFRLTDFELLQYSVYNTGGHYRMHTDMESPKEGGMIRKISFSIPLRDEDEYTGGNLTFHVDSKPLAMTRQAGTLIVFPSYLCHEVTEVTQGTREALVGWMQGPCFE